MVAVEEKMKTKNKLKKSNLFDKIFKKKLSKKAREILKKIERLNNQEPPPADTYFHTPGL
jgi:hypothetical protein